MARTKEGQFQDLLIHKIENELFPGSIVLKNDANYRQGFPDLTVICPSGFTAIIECKKSANEPFQHNQVYYLEHCKKELGHFTIVAHPDNLEEVLYELQRAYSSRG